VIDIILWTKNRSPQCDLNLRSTKKYFKNVGKIFILYQGNTEKFQKGYEKLMAKDYGFDIRYIPQDNFEIDIKTILSLSQSKYILGQSDDNVFIDNVDLPDDFELPKDTVQFSLRLGLNHTYCQTANIQMTPPHFVDVNDMIKWDWTKAGHGDYGYPHNCDSGIYNRQYWLDLIKSAEFKNPRYLEIYMDNHRPSNKPYMMSFKNCKLLSICANTVYSEDFELPNMHISTESMNERWLNGEQIQIPIIKEVHQCHLPLEYIWEFQNA